MNFKRTMIVGSPGAGKTTFSVKLGQILCEREVFHLDRLLLQENWQIMPYEQRKQVHDQLIAKEDWIIDGMWRSLVADRVKRATAVVFLDFKRSLCMRRAFLRSWKNRGKQRFDIADNCPEKLDRQFLQYIWNFNKEVRPFLCSLLEAYKDQIDLVVVKNPKQAQEFLQSLESQNSHHSP